MQTNVDLDVSRICNSSRVLLIKPSTRTAKEENNKQRNERRGIQGIVAPHKKIN